jgi:mRNA turnover protein 4
MPKSKRAKTVSLTMTKKSVGRAKNQATIEKLRSRVDECKDIYVFETFNMRNVLLKEVRERWSSEATLMFGRNKVLKMGLGVDKQSEYADNLRELSKVLRGDCGLFFTDAPRDRVLKFFAEYGEPDYARSGFVATKLVELRAGPLPMFQGTMEPMLRELGLTTSLKRGVVILERDFVVCKPGKALTPNAARILKLLDIKMAVFYMSPLCRWSSDGSFEELNTAEKDQSSSSASSSSSSSSTRTRRARKSN